MASLDCLLTKLNQHRRCRVMVLKATKIGSEIQEGKEEVPQEMRSKVWNKP